LKKLAKSGVYTFFKFESVDDVNKFEVGLPDASPESRFGFFRGLGIVDYPKTFKTWLREFPRPIFIVGVKETSVVSWVYITDFKAYSKEGDSIYVLRATETLERLRGRKLGYRLLVLGLNQTTGFMITKPLNNMSESFFRKAGFMAENEFKRCPIDLSKYHGYLLLPPFKKYKIQEEAKRYFEDDGGQ
jgi:hypothetical protein